MLKSAYAGKGVANVRNQWRQIPIPQGAQEEDRKAQANARAARLDDAAQLRKSNLRLPTTIGEGMTTPTLGLHFSQRISLPTKKRRVLLVDNSRTKRDLRAEIMRKLGMDVDCAADITEARAWWRADLYNLVLISTENEHGRRDKFCQDIRGATPPQQLAFLVGKPEYLAGSPNPGAEAISEVGNDVLLDEVRAFLSSHVAENPSQNWGILEACRRISVVRSAADARTRAIQQRPAPRRDSETARPQKIAETQIMPEPSGKEM